MDNFGPHIQEEPPDPSTTFGHEEDMVEGINDNNNQGMSGENVDLMNTIQLDNNPKSK